MKFIKNTLCVLIVVVIFGLTACSSGTSGSFSRPSFSFNNSKFNDSSNVSNSSITVSTEDNKLAPLSTGAYSFYNARDFKYLSFNDRKVTTDTFVSAWKLVKADNGFYVYTCTTELLLDIDNAVVSSGTTIKLWENTGYKTQIWKITPNNNGTYSFLSSVNESYCLAFDNGNAVLQLRNSNDKSQEWYANPTVDNTVKNYREYISDDGIIQMRLPLNITEVISDARLKQWTNDLEKAYYTFEDLTGYRPYDFVVVKAYEPITKYEGVLGYVYDNCNIIYIDSDFIRTDLAKMTQRVNDWNFCLLHEMGHMFDNFRPWDFEAEFFTDFKISYVLEQNGAGAELSEFGTDSVRYGKDIMLSYKAMSGDLSKKYDVFALAYKFLQIKEQIGWQPIKSTFYKLQQDANLYVNYTKQQKFDLFVNTLSSYSGKNIKGYFTAAELNAIAAELKQ